MALRKLKTQNSKLSTRASSRESGPKATGRAFSADEIERARRSLMRRDPRLRALIKKHGPCGITKHRTRDPFASLVGTITSQQLSTKAADTIYKRVVDVVGGREGLTPDALLAADPTALRAAGLSNQKVAYVRDLAGRVKSGALDLHALDEHGDEDVIAAITAVKGLGLWSAQMFLMFRLNRPDIWPIGDLGIVRGVQHLHGMKRRPSPRTMERLGEAWRPYRSIAAWYLWRISD